MTRAVLAIALGGAFALVAPGLPAGATGASRVPGRVPAKPNAIAKLVIQHDNVSVRAKGKKSFAAAKDGQDLHEGDTVKTDDTGKAEIDYSADAYTRLDVNTTFTIKKLTDDQGNRQVDGSLDTGRTWNRTVSLSESESFTQEGAGATAAVAGTAFAVDCDSTGHCTVTAVVDVTKYTGADGQTVNLDPLDACDATNGVLCQDITHLTPDELSDWIQGNLYEDLILRGLGPGPITGTIVVQNGHATFTPTPSNTNGAPPPSPPGPPGPFPPVIDSTNPIACSGTGGCSPPAPTPASLPEGFSPGSAIVVEDDNPAIPFVVNVTDNSSGEPYFIVFTVKPESNVGVVSYCTTALSCTPIDVNTQYDPTKGTFEFAPAELEPNFCTEGCGYPHGTAHDGPGGTPAMHGTMTFHAETADARSPDVTVPITVWEDECGEREPSCPTTAAKAKTASTPDSAHTSSPTTNSGSGNNTAPTSSDPAPTTTSPPNADTPPSNSDTTPPADSTPPPSTDTTPPPAG